MSSDREEKHGSKLSCATFDNNFFSGDLSSASPTVIPPPQKTTKSGAAAVVRTREKEKIPKVGHRRSQSSTLPTAVPKKVDMAVSSLESIVEDRERPKYGHRRLHSTGSEPRLMRSCGVRRDWTFHELLLIQTEKKEEMERI